VVVTVLDSLLAGRLSGGLVAERGLFKKVLRHQCFEFIAEIMIILGFSHGGKKGRV